MIWVVFGILVSRWISVGGIFRIMCVLRVVIWGRQCMNCRVLLKFCLVWIRMVLFCRDCCFSQSGCRNWWICVCICLVVQCDLQVGQLLVKLFWCSFSRVLFQVVELVLGLSLWVWWQYLVVLLKWYSCFSVELWLNYRFGELLFSVMVWLQVFNVFIGCCILNSMKLWLDWVLKKFGCIFSVWLQVCRVLLNWQLFLQVLFRLNQVLMKLGCRVMVCLQLVCVL